MNRHNLLFPTIIGIIWVVVLMLPVGPSPTLWDQTDALQVILLNTLIWFPIAFLVGLGAQYAYRRVRSRS